MVEQVLCPNGAMTENIFLNVRAHVALALRFPGHKKERIPRVGLSALGPFHEVSADSHEKLSAQALQMGELSLPIYTYKDKWTDFLLMLRLIPNSRTAAAIGHLFLDFVNETGCAYSIPIIYCSTKLLINMKVFHFKSQLIKALR
jgi:hypothetical protein